MMQNRRVAAFFLACLTLGLCLSLSACGKKGDPTLKTFEKPEAPASLTAMHREGAIMLQWHYERSREAQIAEFIVLCSTGSDFEKLSHLEKTQRKFVDRDISRKGPHTGIRSSRRAFAGYTVTHLR